MSHGRLRELERLLKAEGTWEVAVLEAASELADPDLIAQATDRLSARLTVPAGNLHVLSSGSQQVRGMETRRFQIIVPAWGAQAGLHFELYCYRLVVESTSPIGWYLGGSGLNGLESRGAWIGGPYSIPFASDPFRVPQATNLDWTVTNEGSEDLTCSMSLWCRVREVRSGMTPEQLGEFEVVVRDEAVAS